MELESFMKKLKKDFSLLINAEVGDYFLEGEKEDADIQISFSFDVDNAETFCGLVGKYIGLNDYSYTRFSHSLSWFDGVIGDFQVHCIGRQEKDAYIVKVRVYRE